MEKRNFSRHVYSKAMRTPNSAEGARESIVRTHSSEGCIFQLAETNGYFSTWTNSARTQCGNERQTHFLMLSFDYLWLIQLFWQRILHNQTWPSLGRYSTTAGLLSPLENSWLRWTCYRFQLDASSVQSRKRIVSLFMAGTRFEVIPFHVKLMDEGLKIKQWQRISINQWNYYENLTWFHDKLFASYNIRMKIYSGTLSCTF